MLPGAHRVRAKLSGGRLAEYWYAWRGGPRILQVVARNEVERDRLVAAATPAAADLFRQNVSPKITGQFLSGLITQYLGGSDPSNLDPAAEYARLGVRTKADIRNALDVVRRDLGELETKALEAPKARAFLIKWRDRYKATPKTADERMSALARVLKWAHDRGDIGANPLTEWPRLYQSNRAEQIWTKADLIQLLKGAQPDFRIAVLLAAQTSLRLADLVRLTWADVGQDAITVLPNKGRRKGRVVTIPITPKIRAILRKIGRKDVGAVLTHSRGQPWTGWGLQTAMQRHKAERGIKGLTFHDLRGTGCTNLVLAGLPPADVAMIMGWAPTKIDSILRRYVTGEAVARGMLTRLRKNKTGSGL
jgi:integrase